MSTVVTNPTPKAKFQSVPARVSRHRDLIASEVFEEAADRAMLQFASELARDGGDLNQAASKHLRLQGAHEFLYALRNLGESSPTIIPARAPTLDYKA